MDERNNVYCSKEMCMEGVREYQVEADEARSYFVAVREQFEAVARTVIELSENAYLA